MNKLYIKDINKLNLELFTSNKYYQLFYKINNDIKLKNIITNIHVKNIEIYNQYIKIFSDNLENIKIIDDYLASNINNYIRIFTHSTQNYIALPINYYTQNISRNKYISIYIIHVKKNNNIPIIHLV